MMRAMRASQFLVLLAMAASQDSQPAAPSGVTKMLAEVEDRWMHWALATVDCFAEVNCTSNATEATDAFTKSCSTVTRAVIQSSNGDKSRVQSYLADVCSTDVMKGEKSELCLDYAQLLAHGMSEDERDNAAGGVDLSSVCLELFHNGFLGKYAAQETDRRKQVVAEHEAEEQKKVEAAEAAQAQAEADAKAAEARKRLDEAAAETKLATQKREDAVRAAVEAQRKAEEVEKAEAVQRHLEEEAQAAENEARAMKANATHAGPEQKGNVTAFVTISRPRVRKSFLATFPHTFS